MSSDTAMKKYSGGVAEYRSSEGKTVEVCQRLFSLSWLTRAGGLQGPRREDHPRSAGRVALGVYLCEGRGEQKGRDGDEGPGVTGDHELTHEQVGAAHLKEMSKRTTFIRVTQQVSMTKMGIMLMLLA
eukprot:763180-Hanusia_phi.AAC.4